MIHLRIFCTLCIKNIRKIARSKYDAILIDSYIGIQVVVGVVVVWVGVQSPLPLADLARPAPGPPTRRHTAQFVVHVDADSADGPKEPAVHVFGKQGQGQQNHQEIARLHSACTNMYI